MWKSLFPQWWQKNSEKRPRGKMMKIIEKFRQLAKSKKKTIVLPEGEEDRVIKAAYFLKSNQLVSPILLGNPEKIEKTSNSLDLDISNVEIMNPGNSPFMSEWTEKFFELRRHKNISMEEAALAIQNSLYFGAFAVREGLANGAVAGSINTTGDVLRAGIQVLGLAENVSVVSSSFIMALPDEKILTFADCAVIPNPDEEQLASIAISSAQTHEKLVEENAKVAMLSFSTKGSATHEDVDKVLKATQRVRDKKPELLVDGELQFDAAFVESVAVKKAENSPVAGQANVYIFPDLDAGNIGYKIAQRIGGAEAIGPIIQGLKQPFNDLSRGCNVEDIINVACICAIIS
jgi:phosphate acetyltransferase